MQLPRNPRAGILGDPDASAYEHLFSFASPEEKNEFLNVVRSNEEFRFDLISERETYRQNRNVVCWVE